eukprot:scaffold36700_cov16-Tisochrysis_lutea.AAC.1
MQTALRCCERGSAAPLKHCLEEGKKEVRTTLLQLAGFCAAINQLSPCAMPPGARVHKHGQPFRAPAPAPSTSVLCDRCSELSNGAMIPGVQDLWTRVQLQQQQEQQQQQQQQPHLLQQDEAIELLGKALVTPEQLRQQLMKGPWLHQHWLLECIASLWKRGCVTLFHWTALGTPKYLSKDGTVLASKVFC